jgi:hypothetical protein
VRCHHGRSPWRKSKRSNFHSSIFFKLTAITAVLSFWPKNTMERSSDEQNEIYQTFFGKSAKNASEVAAVYFL